MKAIKARDGNWIITKVIGKGKTTVVLVHGIGGNTNSWLPFALPFLNQYRFVIPNLRGFGASHATPYTQPHDAVRQYADDIQDVILSETEKGEKVILCGLSMGAYSCMAYFEKYGTDHVYKYLNVDQSAKAINDDKWQWGLCGSKQPEVFPTFLELTEKSLLHIGKPFHCLPKEIQLEYFKSMSIFFGQAFHRPYEKFLITGAIKSKMWPVSSAISVDCWESYLNCLISYVNQNYDFRKIMTEIDIPVFCHIGTKSEMYPAEGQLDIAENAKNGLAVSFNEGHGLMYTSPILFTKHFKDFLEF